jgi:hypothetical protein
MYGTTVRNMRPKTLEISNDGGIGCGGYRIDHPANTILRSGAPATNTWQYDATIPIRKPVNERIRL